MSTIPESESMGWKTYIGRAIIGIIIIGMLYIWFVDPLGQPAPNQIDYCDAYGEAALNYSSQYPDLFQHGNMSTVSPDTLYTLDKYLNLSRDYFLCEAERHGS